MARLTVERNLTPTLDAARHWIDNCLIGDRSLFGPEMLWTAENISALREAFVDHPDDSASDFMTKFRRQLRKSTPEQKQFAAEVLWALLLFPSNVKASTKRSHIRAVWKLSGDELPEQAPMLSDAVLGGIGSGGPGFNNHRPRELTFLIRLIERLKQEPPAERTRILRDYDAFVEWVATVRQEGKRQYRHMLRYFAFPDRVERMSSNTDRKKVLAALDGHSLAELNTWSDRQLDDALLKIRTAQESKHAGQVLDFYSPPLVQQWKEGETEPEPEPEEPAAKASPVPQSPDETLPRNVIYYGPPGTGKTYKLRELMSGYTDAPKSIERFRVVTFHPSFGYEEFVRGIRPVADRAMGTSSFQLVDGVFKQICDLASQDPSHRYALFIDEINRANIAKVFGELITLIEPDKRIRVDAVGCVVDGVTVQLAGGQGVESAEAPFGVPRNLDIFGTMNTADRSIALLDIALRRRFEFVEMPPDYDVLTRAAGQVQLAELLARINDRLEFLLDRDHRIGHAYLMNVRSLEDLRRAFHVQIIPLLQEYFFDDFSRVATVLSTSSGQSAFVRRDTLHRGRLFPGSVGDGMPSTRDRYVVTSPEDWQEADFVALYRGGGPETVEGSA